MSGCNVSARFDMIGRETGAGGGGGATSASLDMAALSRWDVMYVAMAFRTLSAISCFFKFALACSGACLARCQSLLRLSQTSQGEKKDRLVPKKFHDGLLRDIAHTGIRVFEVCHQLVGVALERQAFSLVHLWTRKISRALIAHTRSQKTNLDYPQHGRFFGARVGALYGVVYQRVNFHGDQIVQISQNL